jgi:hypothetical protein
MSLYEFSCIRSGWMIANASPEEKTISEEKFERIVEIREEHEALEGRVLTAEEFLAMNMDKVRPS